MPKQRSRRSSESGRTGRWVILRVGMFWLLAAALVFGAFLLGAAWRWNPPGEDDRLRRRFMLLFVGATMLQAATAGAIYYLWVR
jgi:hypothetical protein